MAGTEDSSDGPSTPSSHDKQSPAAGTPNIIVAAKGKGKVAVEAKGKGAANVKGKAPMQHSSSSEHEDGDDNDDDFTRPRKRKKDQGPSISDAVCSVILSIYFSQDIPNQLFNVFQLLLFF